MIFGTIRAFFTHNAIFEMKTIKQLLHTDQKKNKGEGSTYSTLSVKFFLKLYSNISKIIIHHMLQLILNSGDGTPWPPDLLDTCMIRSSLIRPRKWTYTLHMCV